MASQTKFRDYRQESRGPWGCSTPALTGDQLHLGAMLRIADALEKLCSLLDPEEQRKRQYARRSEQLAGICRKGRAVIRGKLLVLHAFCAARANTRSLLVRRVEQFFRDKFFRDDVAMLEFRANLRRYREAVAGFDPLTFDWKAVELTAALRRALAGVIAPQEA